MSSLLMRKQRFRLGSACVWVGESVSFVTRRLLERQGKSSITVDACKSCKVWLTVDTYAKMTGRLFAK